MPNTFSFTTQFCARLILALFLAGSLITGRAANEPPPAQPVDGRFIRDWLILGPFSSRDLETDYLEAAGGEAKIRPKEGEFLRTKHGKNLVWTRLRSDRDIIDLDKVFGTQQWAIAYAYCELECDEAMETDAIVAVSRDPGALWINGEKVRGLPEMPHRRDVLTPTVPIQLKKGRNSCLLKVELEGQPPWTFAVQPLRGARAKAELRITDRTGAAVSEGAVDVYDRGGFVGRMEISAQGKAEFCFDPVLGPYDFRINSGEMGTWLNGITLRPGDRREIQATITNAICISGRTLTMNRTPQNSIVVQAISDSPLAGDERTGSGHPKFTWEPQVNDGKYGQPSSLLPLPRYSESVLSDTNGNFRFVNLRPGAYRLRAHGAGGFAHPRGKNGEAAESLIKVGAGQPPSEVEFTFPRVKKGVWTKYPIRNGLTDEAPNHLHRTPDGMLWVGTGLRTVYAYDGVEHKIFSGTSISGNYIEAIENDAKGAVWIGTDRGINKFVNGRMESPLFLNSLPIKNVCSIVMETNGVVWLSTPSGLCKYDGENLVRFGIKDGLPGNQVGALARAKDGALWMSTGLGIARFDGQKFFEPLILNAIRAPDWERLFQAKDGAIWFCSPVYESAAYRYDGKTLSRLGEAEGFAGKGIFDVAQTSDGTLWFATAKGISSFDGTNIVHYTDADGLSPGDVHDIYVDSDDVIWCATMGGVSRFDPKGFSGINIEDGLTNKLKAATAVFAIEPDPEGGYLLGTEWGGVRHLSPDGAQLVAKETLIQGQYVRHIQKAGDGTLWFGASDGIYKEAGAEVTKFLNRNWIIAMNAEDPANLWFGHGWIGGGVSRYNLKTGEETNFTRKQGLPDDNVWALARATKGGIWVGTGAGLALLRDGKVENFTEKLGLPSLSVMSLHREGDDTLWIGTGNGLIRLQGTNFLSLTNINGRDMGGVWGCARGKDGILWIGTDKNGLLGYDGQAVTMIDKRDGLLGNQVFTVRPQDDGSVLAGMADGGLSHFRPTRTKPSVRVVGIKVQDQTFNVDAKLPFTETDRAVSVQYQEIDLKTLPEKRQFRYSVQGPAGATLFTGLTKERRFEWTPHKRGTYTFEVQAIDRDLNYSPPARITLQAIVPWHANLWVTAPGSAAVVGLLLWAIIAGLLYFRKNRETALLRERVRISRDLHDQLGAGLTHISMVGDMVGQQKEEPAAVQLLAKRLSESARDLTRTMGEVIWATDPEKDTLKSFTLFITHYAEQFFADSPVRLRFDIPANLPNTPLPAELRNSLFMVAKEALNNVAKHAQASELRIKVELSGRDLEMTFVDDGQGFSRDGVGIGHHGLSNMEKRLRDLGGQLEIRSSPGKGTCVFAQVRLPKG